MKLNEEKGYSAYIHGNDTPREYHIVDKRDMHTRQKLLNCECGLSDDSRYTKLL
jgi:hypothetical protein